ncbi:hypothetical protein MCUN1_000938 [Malassezia cuniculi]|uniref:J domain-containing protein n=1 Tax=Malassezia cuniculi TaxID=948313 RepID=A0AAF0ETJ0_9BASI|nr:hypothetical protein MCUN1_000938 [Malassezia cuniculi]
MPFKPLKLRTANPGSLASGSHRAAAYLIAAIGLFAFRLVREILDMETSMYTVLHVGYNATEGDIRKSYRELARIYHPDKVGPEKEHIFVGIHDAYSTLADPVLRFAYDRFGAQVTEWRHASSVHDYMATGMEMFFYAQLYIIGIHAFNWLISRHDARNIYTLGTYWGALLQLAAIAVQLYFLTQGMPAWLARSTGSVPFQINLLLLRLVPSFLLALESCADAIQRLLTSGSRKHFAFGDAHIEHDIDAESSRLMNYLQEDPRTLVDAQEHLELVASGILQLEERILLLADGVAKSAAMLNTTASTPPPSPRSSISS